MTEAHFQLLKQILAVQTVTGNEQRMIDFLSDYFRQKGYEFYLDHKKNIYVTKGVSEIYPCVTAHTDTVHRVKQNTNLNVEEFWGHRPPTFGKMFNDPKKSRLLLRGRDDLGNPTGIGGDDKCGVFVCLRLLEIMPCLKVAFFVSEETGCWGSREADPEFFKNVGYTIQFDAPGNHLVTEVCSGIRLFDRNSEFFSICSTIIDGFGKFKYESHPYTDVSQLKRKFPFACINISCGYYQMHSPVELVDVEDVERAVQIGQAMIEGLGLKQYEYIFDEKKEYQKWEEQMKKFREKYSHLYSGLLNDEEWDRIMYNPRQQ